MLGPDGGNNAEHVPELLSPASLEIRADVNLDSSVYIGDESDGDKEHVVT